MKTILAVILLSGVLVKSFASQDNAAPKQGPTTSTNIRRRPRSEIRDNGVSFSLTRFGKKPKKKNLDRDYLVELLGGGYDVDFLSEEEPEVLTEVSPPIQLNQDVSVSWTAEHIHKELDRLNLTNELLEVGGKDIVENEKSLVAVKRWLLKKASCPIHYTWIDIGPYFWPRWLKRGVCSSSDNNCSWPSGMYCTPAEATTVQVLRWRCPGTGYKVRKHRNRGGGAAGGSKTRGGWRRGSHVEKKKCQWIQVPYPITSACLCRC